ncbi:hypothetical protein [Anabaena sp. 90]|uniref:hypothetical protein n=1 Tax=Anabaena sp. 90 TaxID=46234 RepID=UPI00059E7385|nr:hypothetical protein [Anabaena sp. 90]
MTVLIKISRLALKIVVMALGKRQEARGKRQEARGKSEEGLGDFTFRYILRFFAVHLLSTNIINNEANDNNIKLLRKIEIYT